MSPMTSTRPLCYLPEPNERMWGRKYYDVACAHIILNGFDMAWFHHDEILNGMRHREQCACIIKDNVIHFWQPPNPLRAPGKDHGRVRSCLRSVYAGCVVSLEMSQVQWSVSQMMDMVRELTDNRYITKLECIYDSLPHTDDGREYV